MRAERDGGTLRIAFNRPQRHNAFSTDARAALLEALTVALLDHTVTEVVLSGNGPSFCSGGDLAEFGNFHRPGERTPGPHPAQPGAGARRADPPARSRLPRADPRPGAGQRTGDGRVLRLGRCRPDAVLGLPELALGLIPGAGGTLSVTRRIGRWRTAYLVLSGQMIDPATALRWGLVDEIAYVSVEWPS